jgi:hypothetical protein
MAAILMNFLSWALNVVAPGAGLTAVISPVDPLVPDGGVIMVELGLLDVAGGLVVGSDIEPEVWAIAAIGIVKAMADAKRIVFIAYLLVRTDFRDMRREISTATGFCLSADEECLSRCLFAVSCHGVNVPPKLVP